MGWTLRTRLFSGWLEIYQWTTRCDTGRCHWDDHGTLQLQKRMRTRKSSYTRKRLLFQVSPLFPICSRFVPVICVCDCVCMWTLVIDWLCHVSRLGFHNMCCKRSSDCQVALVKSVGGSGTERNSMAKCSRLSKDKIKTRNYIQFCTLCGCHSLVIPTCINSSLCQGRISRQGSRHGMDSDISWWLPHQLCQWLPSSRGTVGLDCDFTRYFRTNCSSLRGAQNVFGCTGIHADSLFLLSACQHLCFRHGWFHSQVACRYSRSSEQRS